MRRKVLLSVITVSFLSAVFTIIWNKHVYQQQQPPSLDPALLENLDKRINHRYLPSLKANTEHDQSSNHLRHIPIATLHDRFHYRTTHTCNNTCAPNDVACRSTKLTDWLKIFKSKKLQVFPLFSENEYVFPWEPFYLTSLPLDDLSTLPHLTKSKVQFVSNGKQLTGQRIILIKKQPAVFRVDLMDGYGHRRLTGGDEVRVWITGYRAEEELKASGFIQDLGNGSYLATVTPLWTGQTKLLVGVPYPKEYIRAALHHQRLGSHRFVFGKFKQQTVEEVTLCHSTPNVPGRPCVCNFTDFNSLPYYCGRPLDKRLSCQDWSLMNTVRTPGFKDLTPAEQIMEDQIARPAKESLIQHDIQILVTENETNDPKLTPCKNTRRSVTWTKESPRGMWSADKTIWTSQICLESNMTKNWIHTCLKSTSVWVIGDSNIRQMAFYLAKIIECNKTDFKNWPSDGQCYNKQLDIFLYFRPHEYPLYVKDYWLNLLSGGAVSDTLDSIPSTGDHIVVLHYYLHFASSHLSALVQRLTIVKRDISKLLARNPRVLVAIRGPHISTVQWHVNHMFGGDVLGSYIAGMYHEVFRDLQNDVVFLDGWDMTISFENEDLHPPHQVLHALCRTLLSFKCFP